MKWNEWVTRNNKSWKLNECKEVRKPNCTVFQILFLNFVDESRTGPAHHPSSSMCGEGELVETKYKPFTTYKTLLLVLCIFMISMCRVLPTNRKYLGRLCQQHTFTSQAATGISSHCDLKHHPYSRHEWHDISKQRRSRLKSGHVVERHDLGVSTLAKLSSLEQVDSRESTTGDFPSSLWNDLLACGQKWNAEVGFEACFKTWDHVSAVKRGVLFALACGDCHNCLSSLQSSWWELVLAWICIIRNLVNWWSSRCFDVVRRKEKGSRDEKPPNDMQD